MTGLELSKLYYKEIGKPMLEKHFSAYIPRIAVGLAGEGSDCLGYDDIISQDHDFGPGFCIWLNSGDFKEIGQEMQKAYDNMPKEFMSYSTRNTSPRGSGRVGVMEIDKFYSRFIGSNQPPIKLMDWMHIPEHKLTTAVSGEVFEDNLGEFSRIRKLLKSYYPEDVRIKKIAARAAVMAQAGQYNYARCMRRKDTVAANMSLAEFVKAAISMLYLLNKTYSPYYKWQFKCLMDMAQKVEEENAYCYNEYDKNNSILPKALYLIKQLCEKENQIDAWADLTKSGFNPYVNVLDKKVVLIENICALVIGELQKQNLTDLNDSFLENHTYRIISCIKDENLRNCHIMEG